MKNDSEGFLGSGSESRLQASNNEFLPYVVDHGITSDPVGMLIMNRTQVGNTCLRNVGR